MTDDRHGDGAEHVGAYSDIHYTRSASVLEVILSVVDQRLHQHRPALDVVCCFPELVVAEDVVDQEIEHDGVEDGLVAVLEASLFDRLVQLVDPLLSIFARPYRDRVALHRAGRVGETPLPCRTSTAMLQSNAETLSKTHPDRIHGIAQRCRVGELVAAQIRYFIPCLVPVNTGYRVSIVIIDIPRLTACQDRVCRPSLSGSVAA